MFKKNKIDWMRPVDYYAEMIKTDDHMRKVKQKLMDSDEKIKIANSR